MPAGLRAAVLEVLPEAHGVVPVRVRVVAGDQALGVNAKRPDAWSQSFPAPGIFLPVLGRRVSSMATTRAREKLI